MTDLSAHIRDMRSHELNRRVECSTCKNDHTGLDFNAGDSLFCFGI